VTGSVVGFGTWPIGGARYGKSDDAEAIAALQRALDLGVTLFDTAPSYGNGHAEELLGRALGGRRAEATIVTKGGLVWNEASQVLGRDSRRERLFEVLDESLRRLRTDHVDLYLIHWPDPGTPLTEVAASLEAIAASGKARAVGVSNFKAAQLRDLAEALAPGTIVANQISFSLFDRRWARDTFDTCNELGIDVMAYGPLAHGLLAGAITGETVFDPADWRASGVIFGQPLLTPENRRVNLAVVARLREFAEARGWTLAQLAIAWVTHQRPVATALVGARTTAEIEDCAGAGSISLSAAEMQELETIMADAVGMTDVMLE
jgi:aryl-alcohol dehydrogenase-like predicted oxidoreductase